MTQTITYPQYRKYTHGRSYFKIISEDEWEEVQIIGSKHNLHKFKVHIFTDRNYLYDLTFDYENNWVKIQEEEYESIRKDISTPN